MAGQINLSEQFGRYIFDISSRPDVNIIVEIGSWNGQGSTRCVYEAIKGTEKKLYSLEIDKSMFDLATREYPKDDKNIQLILGKITDSMVDLNLYSDDFFVVYPREVQAGLLKKDIENSNSVKNVLELIPQKIDFLILDGGEFSSDSEYNILKDRSRIIAADDTKTIKSFHIRHDLIKTRSIIIDEPNSRNGFIICENK